MNFAIKLLPALLAAGCLGETGDHATRFADNGPIALQVEGGVEIRCDTTSQFRQGDTMEDGFGTDSTLICASKEGARFAEFGPINFGGDRPVLSFSRGGILTLTCEDRARVADQTEQDPNIYECRFRLQNT